METEKKQATQRLFEVFTQFKRIGKQPQYNNELRRSEFHTMVVIYKLTKDNREGVKILDISREMEIAPPSVTLMVNNLVKGGFVERKVNVEDRRSVQINLTPLGRSILQKSWEDVYHWLEGVVDYIGVEKSNLLSDLLSDVCLYFKEHMHPESGAEEKHRAP